MQKKTITERFEEFSRDNPEVWRLFEMFTLQLIRAGKTRSSADFVLHRVRWTTTIETQTPEPFRINDHFASRYADRFHAAHPQHAGFFETRRRRAA